MTPNEDARLRDLTQRLDIAINKLVQGTARMAAYRASIATAVSMIDIMSQITNETIRAEVNRRLGRVD